MTSAWSGASYGGSAPPNTKTSRSIIFLSEVHKREKALLVPTVVTGNVSPCPWSFDGYVVEGTVTVDLHRPRKFDIGLCVTFSCTQAYSNWERLVQARGSCRSPFMLLTVRISMVENCTSQSLSHAKLIKDFR